MSADAKKGYGLTVALIVFGLARSLRGRTLADDIDTGCVCGVVRRESSYA